MRQSSRHGQKVWKNLCPETRRLASEPMLPNFVILQTLTTVYSKTTKDNQSYWVCFGSLSSWGVRNWGWSLGYLYRLKCQSRLKGTESWNLATLVRTKNRLVGSLPPTSFSACLSALVLPVLTGKYKLGCNLKLEETVFQELFSELEWFEWQSAWFTLCRKEISWHEWLARWLAYIS